MSEQKKTSQTKRTARKPDTAKLLATAKTPVNFRTGPGYEHSVIRIIGKGEKMAPTGETENGFSHCTDSAGALGWVCLEYIEVIRLD